MSERSRQTMKVFLIGTHHTYQYGVGSTYGDGCSLADEAAFRTLVRRMSDDCRASALAEELNEDGLAEHGVKQSVLQQEAAALGLPHRFCEPSLSDRSALAVQQENDIRIQAWMKGWPEEEVQRRLATEFRKRETVWLERLLGLDTWPALFVCGANHVGSFSSLLAEQGLAVEVLETCWEAAHETSGPGRPAE
jgi:hypothetical protein